MKKSGTGPGTPSLASRVVSTKHASRPFVLLAVLSAAAVVAVLAGVTQPLSAAQFANTGHWVYNSLLGTVFHIDGATTGIDAQLPMDAEPGSQVLQSDSSGFVVGRNRITEFDKASLEERRSSKPPAEETPLGIEVVGGPYAVYRNAGQIVRLGDPAATIPAGGSIGSPVVTDDGTMWFHRIGKGDICRVAREAVEVSGCPVAAPKDHPGALTIVDRKPAFLDVFTSRLHIVDGGSFGEGIELGVPLSPGARPAAADTNGRLAILDQGPAQSSLVLVDLRTTPVSPKVVPLGSGDFDGPVSTGDVVALVDRQKNTVLTFGPDGKKKDGKPIEDKSGDPRLSQGEDKRIYVEDPDGTQVLVVDEDGSVTGVDVAGKPAATEDERERDNDDRSRGPSAGPPPRSPNPPRTTSPPPPPPVPPSRPGVPGGVTARAGEASATVSWGAATGNRAPITAYVVSWQGANGQTGSLTVGGGARTARITGLANGVSYVISVAATNRMGTGAAAAAAAVTPNAAVTPAAPPTNLVATYDEDDRPTRDVTLTWGQPALGGGTLVHYEVAATGRPPQQVAGTRLVFPQVQASETITFTVRAVTRSPSGQTLVGRPASARHENTVPNPAVSIAQGGPSETGNCAAPNCFWVNATMSGFDPGTTYDIRLSSTANQNVVTEQFTTDGSGAGTYNELNYDVPGETVWVSVRTPNGWVESNRISWQGPRLNPQIVLSKGPPTEDTCGEQPDCAWMHVEMTGFAPGTEYHVDPYNDADDGYTNPGYTTTTESDGSSTFDRFAYTGPGESVWVEVDVPGIGIVRSNQVTW